MFADGFDEEKSDASSESGLNHPAGDEERGQDEPNERICIACQGLVDRHYSEER